MEHQQVFDKEWHVHWTAWYQKLITKETIYFYDVSINVEGDSKLGAYLRVCVEYF